MHTTPFKRKRTDAEVPPGGTISTKRRRHHISPDLLSPLSDELLIRVLTFLALPDILSIASVSRRLYHLSTDSQLWKRLYYSRFVLPRALRIPGFRDGSAREGKLHYSSRKTVWADGRRGGWVDMRSDNHAHDESRSWKRQYKLRHNWSRGKCAVEELRVGCDSMTSQVDHPHKMLVKIAEGIALTADSSNGLRAWDLKTKELLAHIGLKEQDFTASPSSIAIDEQNSPDRTLDVAIGFGDGGFGVWRLYISERKIARLYRHEESSNGSLIGIAFSHPYLLTATTPFDSEALSISPGIRLWGHTSGISDAEITARGKAVSVSCRGEEIRVWELEGRTEGKSIEVKPTAKAISEDVSGVTPADELPPVQWNERRNWVGFDDEMVIVLKESKEGKESLMVYDFT
ncbi:hypothetical protein DL769_007654 [Monosporascus sp. CRB-8-3]|nr:hypothetical protein DL769_007654 [Monosporascus sp. CRB-8-3]